MMLKEILREKYKKEIKDSTNSEIYGALLEMVNKMSQDVGRNCSGKRLYYISSEFLTGKLLSNNLINLGIYEEVSALLKKNGKSLAEIEDEEPEPSLGNGGLGRLAACFMDSVSTLGLKGDGVSLCYHFGLFKQKFKDNKQTEIPEPWMEDKSWLIDTGKRFQVNFKDFSLDAKMYDINIIGYNNKINKLHLFDTDTVSEEIIKNGIAFDKKDIKKNLTLFLYPDDSDEEGKLLRLYQQYFMVSSAASLIIDEFLEKEMPIEDIWKYVVVQINDTHPTMIIPELIRHLEKSGIGFERATEIVSKMCAYTNHTILSEALEKWPLSYIEKVSPEIASVIKKLDMSIKKKYKNEKLYIIDKNNIVHMAHIDLHFCFSVNGVASLHTEILKENELSEFSSVYPEKFNNKTNGITFRRWLLMSNPKLTEFLCELIGDGFKKDANCLRELLKFKDDEKVLERLNQIKRENKIALKEHFEKTRNIQLNEEAIFDVQIKRLHEYKRQQLNVLYLIDKFLRIKKGEIPKTPICAIFGAKAAPAYKTAKDIIHLILCLSEIVNKEANGHLNIVMAENYNVSLAEKIIPAADISEQISLASKEASGTGNMKLMLNGAVTIGTEDGANVEIHRLVGDENIYIFGAESDEVVKRYKEGSYDPKKYYNKNKRLKDAVDFITSPKMLSVGDKKCLERLKEELLNKDWFMTFPDFDEYLKVKEKAFSDYEDKLSWARKMLVNISEAGYFSSDRTIMEYEKDIWRLGEI